LEQKTRLDKYNNSWYKPGRNIVVRGAWYIVNALMLNSYLLPFSSFKRSCLRLFGASVGKGVIIKPKVNIKYPWKLKIDDHAWIGEKVWIDNLAQVNIGAHVCISQGAILLTGNHDHSSQAFDLWVKPITLEEGCWIGAKSTVCPGVHAGSHSVLSAGSVLTSDMEPYAIYQGNPAVMVKQRVIQ
jgi:putative colanic acid biosynthesis acetyltransferase WcaF